MTKTYKYMLWTWNDKSLNRVEDYSGHSNLEWVIDDATIAASEEANCYWFEVFNVDDRDECFVFVWDDKKLKYEEQY